MAVEVQAGTYIYLGDEVFAHNPLHDLESLWWVGLWILLCHYHTGNLQNTDVQQHIKVVKEIRETLFNNRVSTANRRNALTGSALLLVDVLPEFFPAAVQHLIFLLDVFRGRLVTNYKIYKPTTPQDRSFFIPDVHLKFNDIFEDAMEELKDDQTGLWLFDHIENRIDYLNRKK